MTEKNLTEQSLEEAIGEIRKRVAAGDPIALQPTKIFIPRHPEESFVDYLNRVRAARKLVRAMAERNRGGAQ